MPPTDSATVQHRKWAVQSRARNQQCAVRLLGLFEQYEHLWKTSKWARAAQDLLSATFSLWRAAFLADKSGRRAAVFDDGREFLAKIIEDNAISYAQDRKCKEWTFNYYTRNARASLQVLAEHWPDQVAKYEGKHRTSTQRWEYCQQLLEDAITEFETRASTKQRALRAGEESKKRKLAAKDRKRRSRAVTLAARGNKTTAAQSNKPL